MIPQDQTRHPEDGTDWNGWAFDIAAGVALVLLGAALFAFLFAVVPAHEPRAPHNTTTEAQ